MAGNDSKPIYIYALADPRTLEVRYVGKSRNPKARLAAHLCSARRKKTHNDCWIGSLLAADLQPLMATIDVADDNTWPWVERFNIALYRSEGARLTNHSDGGEGSHGYRHTPEARAKISAASRAAWPNRPPMTLETRAKLSAASTGQHPTEEARAKMSAARKGKPHPYKSHHTTEQRTTKSAFHRARWTPEMRLAHAALVRSALSHRHTGELRLPSLEG